MEKTKPVTLTGEANSPESALALWYRKPADRWLEALPIGNGRLGAMVFGGILRERIQLNEESLWSGRLWDNNNPAALENLPKVRQLLWEERFQKADALANQFLMGNPMRIRPYQSLGDLWIDFENHQQVTDYRRELDIEQGIVRVQYRIGEANFTRELFVSAPDQVFVARLSCDRPGMLNVRLRFTREQEVAMTWKAGKLVSATIFSRRGNHCRIRTREMVNVQSRDTELRVARLEPRVVSFRSQAGQTYNLTPAAL